MHRKPGSFGHLRELLQSVFMGTLGADRFPFIKIKLFARNSRSLLAAAHQVHLDTSRRLLVYSAMLEPAQIEVG
jgi:hypothetical protein